MTTLQLDSERYFASMPAQVASHADPARPPAQRLVAARGMLPLPTQDQLAVLVALCEAVEKPVAQAAQNTLEQMPVNLVRPVLTNPATPGWLLEISACGRSDLLPDLLSRSTPIGSTCGLLLRRPCRRFTSASVSTCSASSTAPRLSRRSGKTRASIAIFCDPRSSSWSAKGSTSRAFRSLKGPGEPEL